MDKKRERDLFVGTHARIVLSDYPVLADLIIKYSQFVKDQLQSPNKQATYPIHIIKRREIEDAIEGPMSTFFKQKLTAYMTLARIHMSLNILQEDTLKSKHSELLDIDKIPEPLLKNTSLLELSKIKQQLDQLTLEHAKVWEQSSEQWIEHILSCLNKENLSLSVIETKEFKDLEPISALLDRFTILNIDFPKMQKSDMNFSKYLTLKADIAIQSALSRQHKPHSQADIQKILNQLKSEFNAIAKQELEIAHTQGIATHQIVAKLS